MPADKDVTPRKIGANAAAAAALCPAGHRGRPKPLIMVQLCFHWESEEREGGGGGNLALFICGADDEKSERRLSSMYSRRRRMKLVVTLRRRIAP